MVKKDGFQHDITGPHRPQIVLIGNGLERISGQPEWKDFLNNITAPDSIKLTEKEKGDLPLPLLYELLSTSYPAPSHISPQEIKDQEDRLANAVKKMNNASNPLMDKLPELGMDHIFTTNYSYCIEKAFWPSVNFTQTRNRSLYRFNYNPEKKNGRQIRENYYRLHSGYLDDEHAVGIWHIHGEMSAPRGVILGADRYGRNLDRIIQTISKSNFDEVTSGCTNKVFTSWPELFLFGDIYVIGLGYETCDTDLWWLLRRKQRENYSDSNVYFYEFRDETSVKQKLLMAHGVSIISFGDKKPEKGEDFYNFYDNALNDIGKRIKQNKNA